MSQFRSEEMSLVQLFIQNDAAHDTLHELGNVGVLQFKDLNTEKSAFQRLFVQVAPLFDSLTHAWSILAQYVCLDA